MILRSEPLPPLANDAEAEAFVETANLTDYDLLGFAPMRFEIAGKTETLRKIRSRSDPGGSEDG